MIREFSSKLSMSINILSIITSAAMHSTIGTALFTIHGSCLPVAFNIFGSPSYVFNKEVFWGQDRLDFLEEALVK